jgi:hypothetical protein
MDQRAGLDASPPVTVTMIGFARHFHYVRSNGRREIRVLFSRT